MGYINNEIDKTLMQHCYYTEILVHPVSICCSFSSCSHQADEIK